MELEREGHTGLLDYTIDTTDTLSIWHVEVPIALRGKGVGGELVEKARALADEHQLRLNPICPFAKHYLAKHK
jgi:predicted GNAT family acetyltransferase